MSLLAGGRRHPLGTGVCLQEFRNFFFGKIFTVCTGITFRNAATVGKRDHVEIAILSVDDTYLSIVEEASLNDHPIRILDHLTVCAEVCQRRARDQAKGEN